MRIFTVAVDRMYFFKPSILSVVHNSYKLDCPRTAVNELLLFFW